MRRRLRMRRRRLAAGALAAIAAVTATTAAAEPPERAGDPARIDVSSKSVAIGDRVTLRGRFPGAERAAIEIRQRPAGSARWRRVTGARTNADGRYEVRVKPRRTGRWQARLAAEPASLSTVAQAAAQPPAVDRDTGTEPVSVRSRTKTKVRGRDAVVGRKVVVRGKVTPAGAERRVVVRIGKHSRTTSAGRNGRFSVRWSAPSTGSYPVRVRAHTNRHATGSRDRAGRVTAYRPATASWYGPGLYGNPMACGGTLNASTLGVAHKTMPCGTKLRLAYGKRSVAVRVVDRGPFAGNREFDLTGATRQRLGFPDTGTVLSSK